MAKKMMTWEQQQQLEQYKTVMAPVMARLASDWIEDCIKRHDFTASVMSTSCPSRSLMALDDGVYGIIEMTVKAGQADEQSIKLLCSLDGESFEVRGISVLPDQRAEYGSLGEEALVSVLTA